MSIDFVTSSLVPASEMFDGRLGKFGVREYVDPDNKRTDCRCLTDGVNFMWAYIDDDGVVALAFELRTQCHKPNSRRRS
jgi:hypothetical protein